MPIIDDYEAIAKRARELKLPVQAQSHKVSDREMAGGCFRDGTRVRADAEA